MATLKEKISFYLEPEKANELRTIANEERRTVTAVLEAATDRLISEHQTNGSDASQSGKRVRAATKGT